LKTNSLFSFNDSDQTLLVKLGGEIDHHNAVAIRGEIDSEIRNHMPKKTVLDLSDIDFMDSSGLGLIMGRYSLMQKIGGELTVKNPSHRIIEIFELAGLGRMVRTENDNLYTRDNTEEKK